MRHINGGLLRHRRQQLNESPSDVSAATGLPIHTIRTIERSSDLNKIGNAPIGALARLAEHLAVPMTDLLQPEKQPLKPRPRESTGRLIALLHYTNAIDADPEPATIAAALGWTLTVNRPGFRAHLVMCVQPPGGGC